MNLVIHIFLITFFYSVLADSPIVTPSESIIKILPGRNVVLKARYEQRQLLNCSLIAARGELVNLVPGYHLGQNLTYWGDGYDNGECGVLLRHLSSENSGLWTLVIEIQNIEKKELINFMLQVYDSTPKLDRNYTQYLNENYPGEIILGLKDSNFCQGRLPNGTDLPCLIGQCRYKVYSAQISHAGTWTANYSTNSLMTILQDKVEVVVNPSTQIEGYVEPFVISHEYTNLLCKYNSLNGDNLIHMDYCYFIPPNSKEKILINEGIGTEDYIFYGKGLKGLKSKECGLTFFIPNTIKNGIWTCVFGNIYGFEVNGTFEYPPPSKLY